MGEGSGGEVQSFGGEGGGIGDGSILLLKHHYFCFVFTAWRGVFGSSARGESEKYGGFKGHGTVTFFF